MQNERLKQAKKILTKKKAANPPAPAPPASAGNSSSLSSRYSFARIDPEASKQLKKDLAIQLNNSSIFDRELNTICQQVNNIKFHPDIHFGSVQLADDYDDDDNEPLTKTLDKKIGYYVDVWIMTNQ